MVLAPLPHFPLPSPHAVYTMFQILSERVEVSGDSPCCSLDPITPEDLPRQGMGGGGRAAMQKQTTLVKDGEGDI